MKRHQGNQKQALLFNMFDDSSMKNSLSQKILINSQSAVALKDPDVEMNPITKIPDSVRLVDILISITRIHDNDLNGMSC